MPQVHIKDVRMSFNDLFEPREFKGNVRYGAKLLIVPGSANDKTIWAAINEAATEKFGKKATSTVDKHKTNNMKFCYINGDQDNSDEHDGHMILSANRPAKKGRPTVIDGKRNPLQPADGKPYSGCYVNAIVDIYAQTGETEGVRCGLGGVQFVRDGDAFSGGSTPSADAFEEVAEGADADDSLE